MHNKRQKAASEEQNEHVNNVEGVKDGEEEKGGSIVCPNCGHAELRSELLPSPPRNCTSLVCNDCKSPSRWQHSLSEAEAEAEADVTGAAAGAQGAAAGWKCASGAPGAAAGPPARAKWPTEAPPPEDVEPWQLTNGRWSEGSKWRFEVHKVGKKHAAHAAAHKKRTAAEKEEKAAHPPFLAPRHVT